jgi:hypothetical protein
MIKTTDMTVTNGQDQFYPTPKSLAEKMVSGLDFHMIQNVLEPSAGKGDLIDALIRKAYIHGRYNCRLNIDAVEIDPYLRSILKYNFSERRRELLDDPDYDRMRRICFSALNESEQQKYRSMEQEVDILSIAKDMHIVHDDFLTFHTCKNYNLILMNPPFSDGDKHLMKAIEIQEVNGGAIICLLNAETIRNPYTPLRMLLVKKLQQYNADIEYVDNAFSDAERKAGVTVAIVKLNIPEADPGESDIWERMKKAEEAENIPDPELEALVAGDYIEQAIQLYKTEVAATMELVRQYKALIPYMPRRLGGEDQFDKSPILTLTVGDDNYIRGFDLNKYLRTVRLKYWNALFTNEKFTGKLTSDLQKKYRETVSRMADYDFTAFNIKQVAAEMNQAMRSGVEDAIMKLFNELSSEHSWYPECSINRHYFNGWATNKAHKVGAKCIIPVNGMFSSYSWSRETFDQSNAYAIISDLEKALNYLDASGDDDGYSLSARLSWANQAGKTRNIELKYFKIDLFKKGTMHIKFLPEAMPIVDRLNIYASRKRNWLPPNYGKSTYSNMTAEEKAVVDSFHGDGSDGSGAERYAEVLRRSSFYLADPTSTQLALSAAQ